MKLKTHSGAKKRFKRTGTGKLLRKKAGRRHLLTGKGRDRKRRLKGSAVVSSNITMAVNRILP
jgi:large subunit ribosomal protein L35